MKNKLCAIISLIIIGLSVNLISKEEKYSLISPEKISDYKHDRIAYQRIEKPAGILKYDLKKNFYPDIDNSVENLLIIRDRKIHFIADGYDPVKDVFRTKVIINAQNKYNESTDIWVNKINGKPDYVRMLYRRNDVMSNSNEEFVTNNFGAFYKSVRDTFLKLHVEKYRRLLKHRTESMLTINKREASYTVNPDRSDDVKKKYSISAKAKSMDGIVYYCEDADDDGITETFSATLNDGFNWGIDSGPNIIFIYGNTDKDIEKIIGNLVKESVYGTEENDKKILQQFPSEKDAGDLMQQLVPPDKFYE
jgi:hypothetical protein